MLLFIQNIFRFLLAKIPRIIYHNHGLKEFCDKWTGDVNREAKL